MPVDLATETPITRCSLATPCSSRFSTEPELTPSRSSTVVRFSDSSETVTVSRTIGSKTTRDSTSVT